MASHLDQIKVAIDQLDADDLMAIKNYIKSRQERHPHLAGPSLITLPPELRNKIWSYTKFILPTQVRHYRAPDRSIRVTLKNGKDVRQPAITRTCRLLRAEILPIFYGANPWGTDSLVFFEQVKHRIKLYKQVKIMNCSIRVPGCRVHYGHSDYEEMPHEQLKALCEQIGFQEGVLEVETFRSESTYWKYR